MLKLENDYNSTSTKSPTRVILDLIFSFKQLVAYFAFVLSLFLSYFMIIRDFSIWKNHQLCYCDISQNASLI